jgi:hypothetical protein
MRKYDVRFTGLKMRSTSNNTKLSTKARQLQGGRSKMKIPFVTAED